MDGGSVTRWRVFSPRREAELLAAHRALFAAKWAGHPATLKRHLRP